MLFATGWESRPANGNFNLRIDVIIENDGKDQRLVALPQIELSWVLARPLIYPANRASLKSSLGRKKPNRRLNTKLSMPIILEKDAVP
jgi:hypothetical protein